MNPPRLARWPLERALPADVRDGVAGDLHGMFRRRGSSGASSRAFGQLASGAAAGMLGAVAVEQVLEGEMFQGQGAVILPVVAVFMTVVGLLAALGPPAAGSGFSRLKRRGKSDGQRPC